jgi:hypothetical protein
MTAGFWDSEQGPMLGKFPGFLEAFDAKLKQLTPGRIIDENDLGPRVKSGYYEIMQARFMPVRPYTDNQGSALRQMMSKIGEARRKHEGPEAPFAQIGLHFHPRNSPERWGE